MIEHLTVHGLRGFTDEQTIDFALPTGTHGSGLTVLVGPNGGGKSTLLEAVRAAGARTEVTFPQGHRNIEAGDAVTIAWRSAGQEGQLLSVRGGSSEIRREGDLQTVPNIVVIPSRRSFNPFFGSSVFSRVDLAGGFQIPTYRGQGQDAIAGRLLQMERSGHRDDFDALVSEVAGEQLDWSIDRQDSGQFFIKVRRGGGFHTSDGLGEGTLSLLVICDALYDSTPGDVIVIDEPELSLHPIHQRRLRQVFSRFASDRQIVVATHSPYFVDWDALSNGGLIARIYSTDGGSKIAVPPRETLDLLTRLTLDVQNPHVLGLNASEVFFLEDRVILSEGQEDVVIYRKLASELGVLLAGEFFGWGVGGASKMATVTRLLRELGYQRVVGILDGNRADQAVQLRTEFPEFRFLVIPTDDVRTKPARPPASRVEGLADSSGRLRSEHADAVGQLFADVNAALEQ